MEPWDGPAAMSLSDGRYVVATLDRNGLRPARYLVTREGHVVLASESGVLDIPDEDIVERWRLQPGRMLLIDLEEGRIISDDEIKRTLATKNPYAEWLARSQIVLEDLPAVPPKAPEPTEALLDRMQAFGYTQEDIKLLMAPMATTGQEAVGSMGTDTPISALSQKPKLSEEEIAAYARKMTAFGEWCIEQGMPLAYHHHMAAAIETEPELDLFMKHSGEGIPLLYDAGHMAFAGGDVLRVIDKHHARISHVHTKDVRRKVIDGLDRTRESMKVEQVAKHTSMPVAQATDGMPIQRDHVYIVPPNKQLAIKNDIFYLARPLEKRGQRTPIDRFFRSLAQDQGERAIAIVLSGTGSDGMLGIKEIKAKGAEILGVSTQDEASHRKFTDKYKLNFPLLADTDQKVGKAYGTIGGGGLLSAAKAIVGMADRVTFVIDEKGKIAHVLDKPDTKNHAEEVLALL